MVINCRRRVFTVQMFRVELDWTPRMELSEQCAGTSSVASQHCRPFISSCGRSCRHRVGDFSSQNSELRQRHVNAVTLVISSWSQVGHKDRAVKSEKMIGLLIALFLLCFLLIARHLRRNYGQVTRFLDLNLDLKEEFSKIPPIHQVLKMIFHRHTRCSKCYSTVSRFYYK